MIRNNVQNIDDIISDIKSNDSSVFPCLKIVYENDLLEKFTQSIKKQNDIQSSIIEEMCSEYYEGFTGTITGLLTIKKESSVIKDLLSTINEKANSLTLKNIESIENLSNLKVIHSNIRKSIESIKNILPALDLCHKMDEHIKNNKHDAAVIVGEELEKMITNENEKIRFYTVMKSRIPTMKKNIKNSTKTNFLVFLEKIRHISKDIGERVQKNTLNFRNDVNDMNNEYIEENIDDILDVTAVFKCLHIFTIIDEKDEFELLYRTERTYQIKMLLDSLKVTSDTNLLSSQLNSIIGFLAVEAAVHSKSDHLVPKSHLDEINEMINSKIVETIKLNSDNITQPEVILNIKSLIVNFIWTLNTYGFNSNSLVDLLRILREKYWLLYTQVIRDTIERKILTLNYSTSNFDLNNDSILSSFKDLLENKNVNTEIALKTSICTSIYHEMEKFLIQAKKINEDFGSNSTDLYNLIKEASSVFLYKVVEESFKTVVSLDSLDVNKLIIIHFNVNLLEHSLPFMEQYIQQLLKSDNQNKNKILLKKNVFQNIRHDVINRIFFLISSKMEDYLNNYIIRIDWSLNDDKTLKQMFESFMEQFAYESNQLISLNQEDQAFIYTYICKQIITVLWYPYNSNVVKILSVHSMDCYLKILKSFRDHFIGLSCFSNKEFLCFDEIILTTQLFVENDYNHYLEHYGLTFNRYHCVYPCKLVRISEKLINWDKSRGPLISGLKSMFNKSSESSLKKTLLEFSKSLVQFEKTQ